MRTQPGTLETQSIHDVAKQMNRPWAVILAGGDGMRLRSITKELAGDDRPKQFCKVVGSETLLEQTTRRLGRIVQPKKMLTVVTQSHAKFLDPEAAAESILIQPENRGTAPAILYSLFAIAAKEPGAHVGVFPSDHYFSNDDAFTRHVARAFGAVRQRPDLVIILGVVPTAPETDFGWIETGAPLEGVANGSLFSVRQFWEKPPREAAERLLGMGCLWNSSVIIGSVRALVGLIQKAAPDLCHAFRDAQLVLRKTAIADLAKAIYQQIPVVDFSRDVLAARPASLSVLPMANAGWVDVGRPERVLSLLSKRSAAAVNQSA